MGIIGINEHCMDLLADTRPILKPPYCLPAATEKEKSEVKKMLRAGVMKLTSSPWASLVVFAPKSDDSWRFCIDY